MTKTAELRSGRVGKALLDEDRTVYLQLFTGSNLDSYTCAEVGGLFRTRTRLTLNTSYSSEGGHREQAFGRR
jgi:hypothetical protein